MSSAAPTLDPPAVTYPPPGSAEELAAFHEWLGGAIEKPLADFPVTLQNCVEEFHLWRRDRDRMREAIRPSLERSLRGESRVWNKEEFRQKMAAKGVEV